MRHLADALALLRREPSLRPYVWRPLLAAAGAWVVAIALGAALVLPLLRSLGERFGLGGTVATEVGALLYLLIAIFFGGALYLSLVSIVGGLLFERLSREVERVEYGREVGQPVGCLGGALDSALRIGFALVMAILAFGCGSVLPGLGALVVAAYVGLVDFTSGAYLRRGVGIFGQLFRVLGLPGALGFALVSGLLSLVPMLNAVAAPVLVVAGTLMVGRSEGLGARTSRPPLT